METTTLPQDPIKKGSEVCLIKIRNRYPILAFLKRFFKKKSMRPGHHLNGELARDIKVGRPIFFRNQQGQISRKTKKVTKIIKNESCTQYTLMTSNAWYLLNF